MSFETLEEFFEDLEQRFRGNDLILGNKTIDAQLYSRKPAFECVQIFFHVVHFLQDTACGSLKYTEADSSDSKLHSLCIYNFSYQSE